MSQEPTRAVRWRRRAVPHIRFTWIGMVTVFCVLLHAELMKYMNFGMTGRVIAFIVLVVVPVLAVVLWRAGLLPPERVEEDVV